MYKLTTLEHLMDVTDKSKPVFADTETCGLYGRVRLLQVMQEGWDKALLVEWPNPMQLFLYLDSVHSVWHNAHYDLTTVQQQCGGNPIIPKQFDCAFLLSRLAFPALDGYTLEDIIIAVTRSNPYARIGKKADLQKTNWDVPELTAKQLEYAATDVYYMPQVWERIKETTEDRNYVLDKSTLTTCLDFQWNGQPVIEAMWNKYWVELEDEYTKLELTVNVNSWQQVRKFLNSTESDGLALSRMSLDKSDPERAEKARRIKRGRSISKLLSFLRKYDVARVIGKFKPSARSGRLTGDDENLQQTPRALKEIWGYETTDDRRIIFSDYAQLELRTICAILRVKVMEKLFRAGEDLHMYVAKFLFGEDATADDRQITKTYNFNLLYGGSAGMVCAILLGYGYLVREVQANRDKAKWKKLFREIAVWQEKGISAWRNGRTWSTPFGRKYKGKLMTDQLNIMNQGAGAEVAKLALHYFYPRLKELNAPLAEEDKVLLCNFVHDSYILDTPNKPEIYKAASKLLADSMQEAWFEMSKCYEVKDLPMPVDVCVGVNLKTIEKDYDYKFSLEGMEHYVEEAA